VTNPGVDSLESFIDKGKPFRLGLFITLHLTVTLYENDSRFKVSAIILKGFGSFKSIIIIPLLIFLLLLVNGKIGQFLSGDTRASTFTFKKEILVAFTKINTGYEIEFRLFGLYGNLRSETASITYPKNIIKP